MKRSRAHLVTILLLVVSCTTDAITEDNTWTGAWLEQYPVLCAADPCEFPLPAFSADVALHLAR